MNRTNLIKYTINFLINTKCIDCQDCTFCKLKKYYKLIENPTVKEIETLNKCLFYKKYKEEKKVII